MLPHLDTLRDIPIGTILRGKASGDAYVVTGNYGDRLIGVRTVDITNPGEWEIVQNPPTGAQRQA